MRPLPTLLLLLLMFSSCESVVILQPSDLDRIPRGSEKVTAIATYQPDSLYRIISLIFASNGCPVEGNRDAMQVKCTGKSVEGGTMMKCIAYIEPWEGGSRATFTGEYGLDAMGQAGYQAFTGFSGNPGTKKITYEGTSTKPGIAYQYMALWAQRIPGSKVTFEMPVKPRLDFIDY